MSVADFESTNDSPPALARLEPLKKAGDGKFGTFQASFNPRTKVKLRSAFWSFDAFGDLRGESRVQKNCTENHFRLICDGNCYFLKRPSPHRNGLL
jgi:hypothetical protein